MICCGTIGESGPVLGSRVRADACGAASCRTCDFWIDGVVDEAFRREERRGLFGAEPRCGALVVESALRRIATALTACTLSRRALRTVTAANVPTAAQTKLSKGYDKRVRYGGRMAEGSIAVKGYCFGRGRRSSVEVERIPRGIVGRRSRNGPRPSWREHARSRHARRTVERARGAKRGVPLSRAVELGRSEVVSEIRKGATAGSNVGRSAG